MTTNETATIDSVIYATLTGDATLMNLLAPNNLPAGYQQSIYAHLVPETDPVSKKTPRPPYIMFTQESGGQQDEYGMALNRAVSMPLYRVTVWDTQTGGGSSVLAQQVTDRIGFLLDGLIREDIDPAVAFRRLHSNLQYEDMDGGKIYISIGSIYKVFCH
ncbi:hypothetical protein UFOVP569_4 [uncultured Caudovirales phage]|uniref:Uncharacterized protein n=1 Tax=uncultured Caudovirales phage TaxID=2100421 RepID=A0A6J5QFR8_9CAUD|nr:hypothetical protein UFOVP569_4 [uncultured Caudovirales phage]CAB4183329.1 hypothetical protein UFOVP1093_47 [uncultured Caudovirales phage]CAB4200463.1 hypothetical protein UFOVP1340_46 [uncultured Caudovirales phage]CAB4213504.1 hypothetical protein UFOVP1448_32 [uncultured Caudovirales phage]CAB4218230.1 hypothetical protein UFOVP1600_3 [uncultured Caudovirales phage]